MFVATLYAGIITFSILGATGGLRAGLAFLLIVLFAAIASAIAGYHVGVEQQFGRVHQLFRYSSCDKYC